MEAYGKGHSDVASCLTTVTQILEDTKKGTKRSSKEEDETDDVVMVEKTIDVKDDGHETIDHEVKLLITHSETKSLIYIYKAVCGSVRPSVTTSTSPFRSVSQINS